MDVWCGSQGIISDTLGSEPDITYQECQERCENEVACNFILFGIEVWASSNRCILLKTCDDRRMYNDNDPNVYRRPAPGKKQPKLTSERSHGNKNERHLEGP